MLSRIKYQGINMSVEIANLNINVHVTSNQKTLKKNDVDEKRIIDSVWEKCEEYINLITEQKMER